MLAFLNFLGCFVGSFFLTDATKEIQLQSHSTFRFVNFEEYKFRYLEVPTRIQAPRVWKEVDCAVKCFKTSSCISVNMASAESEDGSFWCELLFADMFNNSQNFKQNSSSHHITKWSPCVNTPCQNGGSCVANYNDDTYKCVCRTGFDGNNCQIDIDDCFSNPCENGGSCTDGTNDYSCTCADGFEGKNCSINIDDCVPNPCANGGSCIDGINDFTCSCAAGFEGKNCTINIDDCSSDLCKNGGTCVDGINDYTCVCAAGFQGKNCRCKVGWTLFNNRCYKFFQDSKRSYSVAKTQCVTLGSLLVTIHSKEESDFVRSLIPYSPSNNNDIWIALNDVAVEGSWVWEDGVALGAYKSWNSDEPNGGRSENCVEMYDASGKWNDMPCGHGRYYVCKK